MNTTAQAIDRQLDERARGATHYDASDSSTDQSIRNAERGNQNYNDNSQHNHLSTPVLLLIVALLFIGALAAAVAIGIAHNADGVAFRAERTAALAHNHADVCTAKLQHLEDVMTIRGIVIPPLKLAGTSDVER